MKKRWRVKTRRSPDQTSPPFRCGEPACQSAEPGSPDRSGEGATSSAPAPDRRGGDECRQNWRGDPSKFHGEETAGRSKRRRKKDRRLFLRRGVIGDALIGEESAVVPEEQRHNASHRSIKISPTGNLCDNLQETGEVSSVPKEESIKRLDLPVRHSSSQSVEAQEKGPFDDEEETSSEMKVEKPKPSPDKYEDEDGQSDKTPSVDMMIADDEEVSCDGEETSSRVIMVKKPKPSSGHRGKIAQEEDEDGYPDKTPPSMDFIETISQGEDEQNSKTIGVHAIEEYNREQGRPRVNPYDLLDVDDETISEKRSYFRKMLNYDSPERDYFPEYEPEELIELYERLALYRIRGYELTVDGKLAALDDVNLKLQYPSSKLYDEGFFQYYEQSLEWYFDPELCKHAHFDDYQRLTLYSGGKYLDWDMYHSTLNTYEDLAYVRYFEELANETKWIEYYIGDGMYKWTRIRDVVRIQALALAVDFPNVSPLLVSQGFMEHIRCMEFDRSHKGFDGLYFEIWKRVAKGKMSFREALLEVHNNNMFPSLSVHIQRELENVLFSKQMKYFYDAHFAGIDKMVLEDKARELITEAVIEMRHLYYLDYARKKLNIAKDIGLIPKGRRREVAQQRNGESGEARVESSGDERGCEKGTEALLVQ